MPESSPHRILWQVGHEFAESLGIVGGNTLRIIVQIKRIGVDGGDRVDGNSIERLGILLLRRIEA